ncbi:MAG: thiaminase II [Gemmatimonadota bacterium]|nr:thiaminase II [Gemmatimonadota bacterium]MDH3369119.1 thiaminase II [Gemmatimonadota bacterium]MDH3479068.1 thiaminase II [Gemmatimonadota bacterium]MDH3570348.1 thiaminase II [Gemmatimonadota bacterium]MDH5551020.1 thiaminase II [Gemmatimonadota bacterium]
MPLSTDLYKRAKPIWDAQLDHPFVRGLRDGTLEIERFKRWVLQDYRYLKEFARIFAWAVAKADRLEAMGWYAKVLDLTLNSEMALHRSYAERFGISAAALEAEPMWPTTRAYTDFLVRTSADGDMADLLAALLPCAWGYVYIGGELANGDPPADQRYADWIAQYASPEFAAAADWLKGELDRVAAGAGEEKLQRLQDLFVLSSRYEWEFWEMCWNGEEWRP